MGAELTAGFTLALACLILICVLVFISRGIIEKTHRKSMLGKKD